MSGSTLVLISSHSYENGGFRFSFCMDPADARDLIAEDESLEVISGE